MTKPRTVTVCSACLQASCWQGEFSCDEYKTANVEEKTIKELKALNLEHPYYWRKSTIRKLIMGPDEPRTSVPGKRKQVSP
jgi:hypothetical protein